MAHGNPWDSPGWHALHREASLIRQLIGSGVTALGRANYADKKGEYYNAFFGLSVGIERLAKLVLVMDHAIDSQGELPDQRKIRAYGHELVRLMDEVEGVCVRRSLPMEHTRPSENIPKCVIECLDTFADAKRGRYANFQTLGDPNFEAEFEPIRKWWAEVADPILQEHYKNTATERRVNANAERLHASMSSNSWVHFINESGQLMQDVRTASVWSGQTGVVQKFGRYYTLVTIRWLACVHEAISNLAIYEHGLDTFFGHTELFVTYRVEDKFLRTRKIWPL